MTHHVHGFRSRSARLLTLLVSAGFVAAAAQGWAATKPKPVVQDLPAFAVYPAPAGISNGDFAGEPSLGIDWRSGATLFMANTSTYAVSMNDDRANPRSTWVDVSSPYSIFNVDPIMATDSRTGTTLAGGDDGSCAVMSLTTSDGQSWSPVAPCTAIVDHPTVGLGPFAGSPPVGSTGTLIAYFCQQYPYADECARSLDGGATWSPGTPVTGGCRSRTGHVKVGADGSAWLPINNCTAPTVVGDVLVGGALSTDNGATWNTYRIPGATWAPHGSDASIGTTPDGTAYEAWVGADTYHPLVAWTHDRAGTWSKIVDLSKTVSRPFTGVEFPAVVGGDNGRVAVAYLGTQDQGASPYDASFEGAWYLFASFSYDGGLTWSTVKVSKDPVERGFICDTGTTCTTGRNLLDFMDAAVTKDGRLEIGFADGCVVSSGCAGPDGTAKQSVDAWASIARQASGRRLFAAYDAGTHG